MTKQKKPIPRLRMPLEEALAPFIKTDPKELSDALDEVKRSEREVDAYVDERVARQMLSRPPNSHRVTPLLIFREVSG